MRRVTGRSRSYSKATSRDLTPIDDGFHETTRDDPVELDSEKLFIFGDRIRTFAKQLKTLKPKILKKRGQKESKHLTKCEAEYNNTYQELTNEIKDLQNFLPSSIEDHKHSESSHRQDRDGDRLQVEIWKQEQEVESLRKQIDKLRRELKEEKLEKENAMMRLSELASSKLRDNNPNIADLSDQNRPTKLAETLSELYDNEWTEAFDELETAGYSDEKAIHLLRDTFMNIYKECRTINGEQYMKRVQTFIESTDMITKPPNTVTVIVPDLLKQQIKEFRKIRVPVIKDAIVDAFFHHQRFQHLNKPPFIHKNTRLYLRKCIEVSWLMSVQDPPLELSTYTQEKFNLNVFREYTKRGPFVAYVVWPVLYLHKDGPILCKGVAQGTNQRLSQNSRNQQQMDFQQALVPGTSAIYNRENKFSNTVSYSHKRHGDQETSQRENKRQYTDTYNLPCGRPPPNNQETQNYSRLQRHDVNSFKNTGTSV